MEPLVIVLGVLVAIAVLYAVAIRVGLPYPTLFVLGGLALAFVPGLPRIELDPDLVLLVFLPPLLFIAATETPIRELRSNIAPVTRLALGLVIVTILVVAATAQLLVPSFGLAAAFTLGAIVAPTDALAATTVFRRLGAPRLVQTLVEGEALFNDATALVAYKAGVAAVAAVVGWLGAELLRRIDEPTVEVLLAFVIPFAAYLPAERVGVSAVL